MVPWGWFELAGWGDSCWMVDRDNTVRLGFWLYQCVFRNTLAGSTAMVSISRNPIVVPSREGPCSSYPRVSNLIVDPDKHLQRAYLQNQLTRSELDRLSAMNFAFNRLKSPEHCDPGHDAVSYCAGNRRARRSDGVHMCWFRSNVFVFWTWISRDDTNLL